MTDGIAPEWKKLVQNEYLDTTLATLAELKNVTPSPDKIFYWTRVTPLARTRVVLIAQDPYPGDGVAQGLAFSCTKPQSSLKAIFGCLCKQKLMTEPPKTGSLLGWAEQGVLLLNRALTTEVGAPMAHATLWKQWSDQFIRDLSKYFRDNYVQLTFILLGGPAQKLETLVDSFHFVTKYGHPSPLARRSGVDFDECPCFADTNRNLKQNREHPIDWGRTTLVETKQSAINELLSNVDNKVLNTTPQSGHYYFTDGSALQNKKKGRTGGYSFICYDVKVAMECPTAAHNLVVIEDYVVTKQQSCNYGDAANQFRAVPPTNIRCEGIAIYEALRDAQLQDNKNQKPNPNNIDNNFAHNPTDFKKKIYIVTDSEFWINMLQQYMPTWSDMDFQNHTNPDLTQALWNLWIGGGDTGDQKSNTILPSLRDLVTLIHVMSHNKSGGREADPCSREYFFYLGNSKADKLAGEGRLRSPIV